MPWSSWPLVFYSFESFALFLFTCFGCMFWLIFCLYCFVVAFLTFHCQKISLYSHFQAFRLSHFFLLSSQFFFWALFLLVFLFFSFLLFACILTCSWALNQLAPSHPPYLRFCLFYFLILSFLLSVFLSKVSKHPFHIVSPSPLPFFTGIGALFLVLSLIFTIHSFSPWFLLPSTAFISYVLFDWGRNISIEATFLGCHSSAVRTSHCIGFFLFILREVFFFVSWFWAYFHFSLRPAVEIGSLWPPSGILVSSPFTVPLLNTTVLLTSGATISWSSSSLSSGLYFSADSALLLTVLLGTFFLCLQCAEYYFSSFTIACSSFGSSFFLLTGLHGLHVLVGTLLLAGSRYRLRLGLITLSRHSLFTLSVWYWHFVDVIWLLLFLVVYVWGS